MIKICGLSTPGTLAAALDAGADWVGFVRFPPSPRHVALDLGAALSRQAAGRAERVLLVVDPTDDAFDEAVAALAPDRIQLHGHETPERVAALRARAGRPVVKALGIGTADDLAGIGRFRGVADHVLLDAKPPRDATLPGGNGAAFDWSLLRAVALDPSVPLVLSGGLDPGNVARAIGETGLRAVDVSSGVESEPGNKDPARIEAFVRAARAALASGDKRRRVA